MKNAMYKGLVGASALVVVGFLLLPSAWHSLPNPSSRENAKSGVVVVLPRVTHWHRFMGSYNEPFWIALPDPAGDHNARVIMSNSYEEALGDVFRVLLAGGGCASGERVVDIGANLGIFAATAAAFGCRVAAVEAQSRLTPYLAATALANSWAAERLEIVQAAVSNEAGQLNVSFYTPDAKNGHTWLDMSMDRVAVRACLAESGCQIETVPLIPAQGLVAKDVVLIKIDVDGAEALIADGLARAAHAVPNVLVEICPPMWRSLVTRAAGVAIFEHLVARFDYEIVLLNQVEFAAYKPGFLARCRRVWGVFRPHAYVMPREMLAELLEDATAKINCKNVLFTLRRFR